MIIAYIFMLIFDFAMLAGTVYVIQFLNWNPWWMVLTAVIVSSSTPKQYFSQRDVK